MENDTLRIHPALTDPDHERTLDWLTALLPLLLTSVIYYRGQALALHVTATGGYLMATLLLGWASKTPWTALRIAPALLCGLMAAFCLPATAPWWLAALLGGVAAAAQSAPAFIARVKPTWRIAQPLVHPVLLAYLLIRLFFAAHLDDYTLPVQFIPVDGVASATPLAALSGGEPETLWRLLFGIHAGTIGEGCAVAILFSAAYLILRRRIRLIAPACLIATVAILSWPLWGAIGYTLYAVLAGGLLLAALLFSDACLVPAAPRDQIVIGVIAGVITVLIRRIGGWAEGAAVGVLVAQALVPFLPSIYKLCRIAWTHIARLARATWTWAKPYLLRFSRFAWLKIVAGAGWLWTQIRRGAKAAFARIRDLLQKKKK
jgi:electron transport complex protein RnfD